MLSLYEGTVGKSTEVARPSAQWYTHMHRPTVVHMVGSCGCVIYTLACHVNWIKLAHSVRSTRLFQNNCP